MPTRGSTAPASYENQNDDVSGSPVLYTLPNGRQILIAGQESGRITALDPDSNGAVLWVAQAGDVLWPEDGSGGMGAATDGELYYRPLGLPDQTGAMAALRPATGERVWYTTAPEADELLRSQRRTGAARDCSGRRRSSQASCSRERGTAPCARTRRETARSCGNTARCRSTRR